MRNRICKKMKRVGSSMVEQRPFKALVAGSSPAQPKFPRVFAERTVEQPRKPSGLVAGSSPAQPNSPAAWVYILRGASGRHYIGCTENLRRRIAEHSRGNNHTTRRLGGDVQLVASKQFHSMAQARTIELALKHRKNPKLAILALQNTAEQPRKPSGLVAGSSPAQPNKV